jgi:hypothetical protein
VVLRGVLFCILHVMNIVLHLVLIVASLSLQIKLLDYCCAKKSKFPNSGKILSSKELELP